MVWAYPVKVRLGQLNAPDMTLLGWLGCKTSTQTKIYIIYDKKKKIQQGQVLQKKEHIAETKIADSVFIESLNEQYCNMLYTHAP